MTLTKRQRELLDWMVKYTGRHGCAPTLREMTAGVRLGGDCNTRRMLGEIERAGYIRRRPHRARAIEIIDRSAPSPAMVRAGAGEIRALCGELPNAPEIARRVYAAMAHDNARPR